MFVDLLYPKRKGENEPKNEVNYEKHKEFSCLMLTTTH